MAAASNHRLRNLILLATLALSAFFAAQGATALLAAKVLSGAPDEGRPPAKPPLSKPRPSALALRKHDPMLILRRNIFDSSLGDLSEMPIEMPELPLEDLPPEEVETPCKGSLRLIGTVVLPGELERSLAAIVGTDHKAGLHRGGADVEGSKIRAIHADGVVLQNSAGLCHLAMFKVDGTASMPVRPKPDPGRAARRRSAAGPKTDRNAGLSNEEMEEGIEKINDSNFNLSRSLLNKVLDNAGKLIGIAAVRPKIENGQSVGMEMGGVRPGTLLTKIGLQNGDVLESVNGQSLSSPDAALGAYTTLRTADKFNLSIQRGGRPMTINYNLQ
jgi:general secretion pathway protein C